MTTRLKKIDTLPGMGRAIVEHDEASKNYRAVDLLVPDLSQPRDRTWRRGDAYNQGSTSTCVAQTTKGILNTEPLSGLVDYDIRSEYNIDAFYRGAQRRDEWPGNNYDGTSMLGICKYLRRQKIIREYRWCFGLNDVLLTLSHIGPVALGVWWYDSMFHTDERGLLTVSGEQAGGHEVELIGVDLDTNEVIGMNSWGLDWGDRGRFRLSFFDLEMLLHEEGDAVVITGLAQ